MAVSDRIIDRVEGISLTPAEADVHHNAIRAADRLFAGLHHLYTGLKAEEQARREPERVVTRWPAEPLASGVPTDMIFAWYAVTACSMVSLLGRIAYEAGHSSCGGKGEEYGLRVCGPVMVYRNKVAAHFAWTAPVKKDNQVDREMSLMPQITWHDDRYIAGFMAIQRTRGGVQETSSHDYRWALTAFHEQQIVARYRA